MRLPQLSHTQAAPKQLRRPLHHNSQPQNASHSQMLPPPPPAKPKPSTSSNPNMSQGLHSSIGPSQSSGRYFGPSLNTQESSRHSADSQMNSTTTNRFLPMNERFPPPSTPANLTDSRRFVSPATRGGTFRPAVFTTNTSSRAPASRAQPNPPGGSGQRMPFVPGK
ncbi:hypothetical protein BDP27DRAFT_35697 [Rhodocollybia butyracea]|uniref:Uncharacterized protein n=1 Tax=Rhodocollybia butyracea TaxID=206335 RepID=A0A9P5UDH0_9AGAR|nr:hypothetical protein BDP27DRAFT_35697 [Rhodocollybia butyracea]